MDSILATGLGLCVRLLVDMCSHGDVRVGGSLVGVWEGVVLHHFVNKAPKSLDPYLAYGIRLLLDLILTESLAKMMVVMLWTGLGVMASDVVVGPSRSRPKHLRHKPSQPLEHPIDHKVRFHRSRTPPQPATLPDISASTRSPESTSTVTPRATSDSSLPSLPPIHTPSILSEVSNAPQLALGSFSREVMPGHLLPPSPISLGPPEIMIFVPNYNDVPPPGEEPHDYGALPLHIRNSFQVDLGDTDLTPTNSQKQRDLPEIDDPAESLTEASSTPLADGLEDRENQPEVHHDSDRDHTPVNPPASLPSPALVPDAIASSSPVDSILTPADELQTPPPEPAASMKEDDIVPLPIMIQPLIPIPPSSNNLEDEEPHVMLDTASVPDSDQTRAERESTISPGNRQTLISRGDLLRSQAFAEEREKSQLEDAYNRAVSEGRKKDAILLEGELEQSLERVKKLHERAARRYYRAHNLALEPLTIDVHRLRVPEAIQMTKKAIRETLSKDGTHLRIIVGRGKHSQGKIPVLKHKIKLEMQRQKLGCAEEHFNPGVLVVILPA